MPHSYTINTDSRFYSDGLFIIRTINVYDTDINKYVLDVLNIDLFLNPDYGIQSFPIEKPFNDYNISFDIKKRIWGENDKISECVHNRNIDYVTEYGILKK